MELLNFEIMYFQEITQQGHAYISNVVFFGVWHCAGVVPTIPTFSLSFTFQLSFLESRSAGFNDSGPKMISRIDYPFADVGFTLHRTVHVSHCPISRVSSVTTFLLNHTC